MKYAKKVVERQVGCNLRFATIHPVVREAEEDHVFAIVVECVAGTIAVVEF